jgi:mannose-6-phosphate isomerase-like protein (cupin superfamily)
MMLKRNVEDEEVKATFYQAHEGALARMILTAPDLRGMDFLAHAILEPGRTIESHIDPYEEIYIVLEGTGKISVGDDTKPVKPLDCTYLPAGIPHALTNDGDENLVILVVAAPPIRDLVRQI